jgi:hypothetical protein
MRFRGAVLAWLLLGFAAAGGCGGSDKGNDGSGASGGSSGSGGNAGSAADGGVTAGSSNGGSSNGGSSNGGSSSGGSAATDGGGGVGGCRVTQCQNHVYACGDCTDNDGDGKIDMNDPDCLGPCHNAENTYYGSVPGQAGPACTVDCYFDQDSGSGNDTCNWNHRCDPLSVATKYPPEGDAACAFDIGTNTPGTGDSCGRVPGYTGDGGLGLYDRQPSTCLNFCQPLTPNGCDCFGCCELPAHSGKFVWLGSEDSSGNGICDKQSVANPDKCRPCTPVKGCVNDCKTCELCLGKDTLPAECTPKPPDGGTAGTAGASGAAGTGGTGGEPGHASKQARLS